MDASSSDRVATTWAEATDEHGFIVDESLPHFVYNEAGFKRWKECERIASEIAGEHPHSTASRMLAYEFYVSDAATDENDEQLEEGAWRRSVENIKRLDDGTFAPKGLGQVLRRGERPTPPRSPGTDAAKKHRAKVRRVLGLAKPNLRHYPTGNGSGQIQARTPKNYFLLGTLNYTRRFMPDGSSQIHIDSIEVRPSVRRHGVGTKMRKELDAMFPHDEIVSDSWTNDGAAFSKAMSGIEVPKSKITRGFERDRPESEWDELDTTGISMWDHFGLSPEPPKSPGTNDDITFAEVKGIPTTTTRVFTAFGYNGSPYRTPIGVLTVDPKTDTVELAYTKPEFRRTGIAARLLRSARQATGLSLDQDTGKRSPMGAAWSEATGLTADTHTDLSQNDADAMGERLLGQVYDAQMKVMAPGALGSADHGYEFVGVPEPPKSPGVSDQSNPFAGTPLNDTLTEIRMRGLDIQPQPTDLTRRIIGGDANTTVARYAPSVDATESATTDYLPERRQLHMDIIRRLLDDKRAEVDEAGVLVRPRAVFTAGGTASGKSTLVRTQYAELGLPDPKHTVHIDPDKIKEMLPEYQQLRAAGDHYAAQAVHRESGDIADALRKQAMRHGLHMIIDGTGNHGPGVFAGQIKRMADAGYEVEAVYVDRPVVDSMQDMVDRGFSDGRYVPTGIVLATHKSVSANFDDVAALPFLRRLRVFSQGRLIAEGGGGSVRPVDSTAFTQFQMKADTL